MGGRPWFSWEKWGKLGVFIQTHDCGRRVEGGACPEGRDCG